MALQTKFLGLFTQTCRKLHVSFSLTNTKKTPEKCIPTDASSLNTSIFLCMKRDNKKVFWFGIGQQFSASRKSKMVYQYKGSMWSKIFSLQKKCNPRKDVLLMLSWWTFSRRKTNELGILQFSGGNPPKVLRTNFARTIWFPFTVIGRFIQPPRQFHQCCQINLTIELLSDASVLTPSVPLSLNLCRKVCNLFWSPAVHPPVCGFE